MDYLLSIVILFPAFAAIFIFLMDNNTAKPFGVVIALIELILVFSLWIGFDYDTDGFQFVDNFFIVSSYGINYSVGVDGISLFLIILNAFIMFICTVYLNQPNDKNHYMVAILFLESILMGLFSSLNILFFYAFWELSLLPVLYIVGVWGTGNRIYAALKFFLYTFAASLIMLLGILYIGYLSYTQLGYWSFELLTWYNIVIPTDIQIWLFLAFFISIAVKIPIIPFHTWLPYIYADAPAIGSVVLSAILLKMGTYALVRFSLVLFPDASYVLNIYISILALFMIIYGGIIAFKQRDVKEVVAYSSISHMGIAILGIFSFNSEGIGGSVFLMVGHGIVSGGLFFLVGMIYHRFKSRNINDFGGISSVMPNYSAFFALVMFANVGLPLTIGFPGEFLSLLGFFKTSPVITLIAGTTIIISAIYMLYLYKNIFFGEVKNKIILGVKDLNAREFVVLVPIAFIIIALGIFPNIILKPMERSLEKLILVMEIRSNEFKTVQHINNVRFYKHDFMIENGNIQQKRGEE